VSSFTLIKLLVNFIFIIVTGRVQIDLRSISARSLHGKTNPGIIMDELLSKFHRKLFTLCAEIFHRCREKWTIMDNKVDNVDEI